MVFGIILNYYKFLDWPDDALLINIVGLNLLAALLKIFINSLVALATC
jgi:hypothetical protein